MVFTRRRSSRLQAAAKAKTNTDPSETQNILAGAPSPPKLEPVKEVEETSKQPKMNSSLTAAIESPSPNRTMPGSFLCNVTTRTPRNRTPIKPAGDEMHPHHHKMSITKPLDEARWLGFFSMGARTEPVKYASKLAAAQGTPTKAREMVNPFSTPEFKFRYKRPSVELSPAAQKIMDETREEAIRIRAQMKPANAEEVANAPLGVSPSRRMAEPKGKAGRFSEAHMAQFKKMDSIANHPSAFRYNPDRFKPQPPGALKRTQSKAELDKPDTSKLARTKSSTASLATVRDEANAGPSKRTKMNEKDDTSTHRPVSGDDDSECTKPSNVSKQTSRNLFSPTKASIARSHSVKSFRMTTGIPSLARSPSIKSFMTPSKPKYTPSVKGGESKTSFLGIKLPSVKSILRSPYRLYSDDPVKIAAGTHIATPKAQRDLNKELPPLPVTAPVMKHVNFTESTIAKDEQDHTPPPSPSPVKFRTASNATNDGAIVYPTLPRDDHISLRKNRRTTMAGMPEDFTFRSDRPICFGPATTGTVRSIEEEPEPIDYIPSGTVDEHKKRKLEGVGHDGASDKENTGENRPAKKAKPSEAGAVKKSASRLPTRKGKRPSALTHARLNMLATPRHRRG